MGKPVWRDVIDSDKMVCRSIATPVNTPMTRWVILACLLLFPAQSPAGNDVTSLNTDDEIQRAILHLSSEGFAERQAAERSLLHTGAPALSALEQAAQNQPPEISMRCLRVIERIMIQSDEPPAEAAERTLERLELSADPHVSSRAMSALDGTQFLREQRAVAAIRRLGGKVDFVPLNSPTMGVFVQADPYEVPGQPAAKYNIWLLSSWKGGEEGLWHVARLGRNWGAQAWGIDVTNVRGSGVPAEAVQALASRLPGARIQERGASLGISCHPTDQCIVNSVLSGGTADRAGIQPGDIITQIDQREIGTFSDLVEHLLPRAPGEPARLQINRGGQTMQLDVALGGWADVDTGDAEMPQLPRVGEQPEPTPYDLPPSLNIEIRRR